MQPTKRGRDGNYDPFDTPYTEGLKAQAKKAESSRLQEHAKLNPRAPRPVQLAEKTQAAVQRCSPRTAL